MTIDEIYQLIGSEIKSRTNGEWTKAVIEAELTGDSISYQGWIYPLEGIRRNMELNFSFDMWDAIDELHRITTEGGNNRWNQLRSTVLADGSFETEFIWDEDLAETMAYINSTKDVPEPKRGAGLDRLKKDQLERKTNRIYDGLVQSLLQNAPDNEWQKLILKLTQPLLQSVAELERAPGRHEPLFLLGEAEAIEALLQLTSKGNHLGWEKAYLTVQPTGAYRFSFEWAGAGEYNLPTLYHREGQVDVPPASV